MPPINQETTTTAVEKVAQIATYGGGGSAVFFGLTANEIAAFIGAACAVAGLVVNWFYKARHYRLEALKAGLTE